MTEPPIEPPTEPFSLLMPLWSGDDPAFFRLAWQSTVIDQTRRPDEVVVVQDGPIGQALDEALGELAAASPVPVQRLVLEHNIGLGPALDRGLAACRFDVVARMDADDVSLPQRFAVQLPVIEAGADIVGSALLEFQHDIGQVEEVRIPPTDPQWIRSAVHFRDPFNHPTVVYRRRAVQRAGGYQDLPLMEDYLLFARMLATGAEPANVAEPLVYYRVGAGAYARRGGVALLRSEIALQRAFRAQGITTRREYARNLLVRGGYRLVPTGLRRLAYRRLIAHRGYGRAGPTRTDR